MTSLDVQNFPLPAMGLVPLVALVCAFLVGLLGFALKTAIGGRPRTERVIRQGGTIFLGEYLMEYGLWLFRPVTRACVPGRSLLDLPGVPPRRRGGDHRRPLRLGRRPAFDGRGL
jgi:hypothetical protein